MKKTLVAMAVMAVAGAASAQVTLYGKIDAGIHIANQTVGGSDSALGNVGLQQNTAGLSGTRWGMKGSEDLGGGMTASFQLEQGFAIDTSESSAAARAFHRQAWVGLTSKAGTLSLGRQYSPIDTAWGTYDGQGYSSNSAMNYSWNGAAANTTGNKVGLHAEPGRINNSILYTAPAMGGLSAQVMYAPGEDKVPAVGTTAGKDASSYTGFLVGYGAGPLSVHLAYENISTKTAGTAAAFSFDTKTGAAKAVPEVAAVDTSIDQTMIGASYDLGMAKLTGGYQRASGAGSEDAGWMIGAVIPAGAVTISLGYAAEANKVSGNANDGKSSAFGGQVVYALSKRTNVYADFLRGSATTSTAAGTAQSETVNTVYGVGVRHDF